MRHQDEDYPPPYRSSGGPIRRGLGAILVLGLVILLANPYSRSYLLNLGYSTPLEMLPGWVTNVMHHHTDRKFSMGVRHVQVVGEANLRSGPSMAYPVLRQLAPGENLQQFDVVSGWSHVGGIEPEGWVSESLIRQQ